MKNNNSNSLFTRWIKWLPSCKNMLTHSTLLIIFVSCSQQPNTIKGYVNGLTNDTVLITSIPLDSLGGAVVSDTIFAKNGRFEYKFPNNGAYDLMIRFPQFFSFRTNGDLYIPEASVLHIFVEPNDKINFKCSTDSTGISNVDISGSKINVDFSNIQNKQYEIFKYQFKNAIALDQAVAENNKEAETIGRAKIKEQYRIRDEMYINYIKSNLENPISAFLLFFQPLDSIGFYYDKLGDNVKNSIFRKMLNIGIKEYRSYNNIASIGSKASDFKLENMNGTLFSLSSLLSKDKYVIIDFWGSWCGPCVAGMPKMKNLYEKYKNKLEIVGIACNEPSVDVWKNAVKQHELPWINVYDDKSSAVNIKYGIKAYPTKIVLNQEGIILIKEEGEKEDFYTKLEELLNKKV